MMREPGAAAVAAAAASRVTIVFMGRRELVRKI
jgi:hypothetical protein